MSEAIAEKVSHCLRYLLEEAFNSNRKKIKYIKEEPVPEHTTIQHMKEPSGSNPAGTQECRKLQKKASRKGATLPLTKHHDRQKTLRGIIALN